MVGERTERRPGRPGRSRRFRAFAWAALLGALLTGAVVVPLPLLEVHPGPTPDVSKLIAIDGPTFPSKGSLHMTTVTVRSTTGLGAVAGWIDRDISVIPREYVYPPGKSEDEIVRENATEMDQSGIAAAVAAYRELGILGPPEGVLIASTMADAPSAKSLRAGDVIVRVDDEAVTKNEELLAVVARHKVGDRLTIRFRRDGREKQASVRLIEDVEKKSRPIIGIGVLTKFKMPYEVELDPGNIGGPSAGLMFSLSIVDRLGEDDLTRGFKIAGTGTIDADGKVGAVGGVAQKVEAAERINARYFFAPYDAGEADEARQYVDSDMEVIEVATIHDAVVALQKLR